MGLVTDGLVNQLDAVNLLHSGEFTDGQSLKDALIPDSVDPKGWLGDGYDLVFAATGGPNSMPVIRFQQGFLHQRNATDFYAYENITVMLIGQRTGTSWGKRWMGLYSMFFNDTKSGLNLMAVTDDNNDGGYQYWGTIGKASHKSGDAMTLNTPVILGATLGVSTPGKLYTNGVPSTVSTFPDSHAQAYYGLGGYEFARGYFRGDIYEVLVYNRILSDSEISQNSTYLYNKWLTLRATWASETIPWSSAVFTWDSA
jgi:hypothetical protein